jgi:hypothetical protein
VNFGKSSKLQLTRNGVTIETIEDLIAYFYSLLFELVSIFFHIEFAFFICALVLNFSFNSLISSSSAVFIEEYGK